MKIKNEVLKFDVIQTLKNAGKNPADWKLKCIGPDDCLQFMRVDSEYGMVADALINMASGYQNGDNLIILKENVVSEMVEI